jgi:hypothetical protein
MKRKARITETAMMAVLGGGGGVPERPPPVELLRDPLGNGKVLSAEEADEAEAEIDAY